MKKDNVTAIEKKSKKLKKISPEWQTTILLLLLLVIAISFIVWSKNQYDTNFIEQF